MPLGIDTHDPVLAGHPLVGGEVGKLRNSAGHRHRKGSLTVPGGTGGETGIPQGFPAVAGDGIEGPGHHQRQHRLGLQARSTYQVSGAGVGAVPNPFLHDEPGRLRPNILDKPQSQTQRVLLGGAIHPAAVHTGIQEGHAEAPGVLLKRLHRVEAHRLIVDQADEELQGVIALEPGSLVGGDGKGVGVGLGEHVAAVNLGEYLCGNLLRDPVLQGPFQEPLPVGDDQVLTVRPGKGPPDLIGLAGGHPRHVHN